MGMSRKDYVVVADALVSAYSIMLDSVDADHREVVADTVREVAAVLACRFGQGNPNFNSGYFAARVHDGLDMECADFLAKLSDDFVQVDPSAGWTFGSLSLDDDDDDGEICPDVLADLNRQLTEQNERLHRLARRAERLARHRQAL